MAEYVLVRVADFRALAGEGQLVTLGLGSCVAILLYDRERKVGGLAHILLPSRSLGRASDNPGRYPQTALPATVEAMVRLGADKRRLTARLVGGAAMFAALAPAGAVQMGDRNVIATRETLGSLGIPVTGELVGGSAGRSVFFDVATGEVHVRSVGKHEQVL